MNLSAKSQLPTHLPVLSVTRDDDMSRDSWTWMVWYHRLAGGYALHGVESSGSVKLCIMARLLLACYAFLCAALLGLHRVSDLWEQVTQEKIDSDQVGEDGLPSIVKSRLCNAMELLASLFLCGLLIASIYAFNLDGRRFGDSVVELRQLSACFKPKKRRGLVSICCVTAMIELICIIFTVGAMILWFHNKETPWWQWLKLILENTLGVVIMLSGFDFASYYAVYLGELCNALSQELHQITIYRQSTPCVATRMDQLYEIYSQIWDTFDAINARLQCLLIIAVPTAVVTLSSLCFMVADHLSYRAVNIHFLTCLIAFMGALTVQLVVTCIASDWMNSQKVRLHTFLTRPEVVRCERECGLNLTGWDRLACRRMCFNPFGFFYLDKTFILTAGGLILTYCVILVQSNSHI